MKRISIYFITYSCGLFLMLLPPQQARAQVNPGDADNNGLVDNHDVLYIGYAFGSVGPRRVVADDETETPQPVSIFWVENFPDGPNYTYADADGNGVVDWLDVLLVYNRYGSRFNNLREISYPLGDPAIDPPFRLSLQDSSQRITEGSLVQIPLLLGQPGRPINEFNGIAFSISYDSAYIREAWLEVDSLSWLIADSEVIIFQSAPPNRLGQLDVTVSRVGQDPVTGQGLIGSLSIIIEDDLVEFRPFEIDTIHTHINLDKIELLNAEFGPVRVVTEDLGIKIINPKLLSAVEPEPEQNIRVYPNPVTDRLRLECDARPKRCFGFQSGNGGCF